MNSDDLVFTFERYQDNGINSFSNKWPSVKLGKLITLEYGKPLKSSNRVDGEYPVFGSNGIVGYHNEYLVEGPLIIVGRKGSAGAVTYSDKSGFPIDTTFYLEIIDKEILNQKFLFYLLGKLDLRNLIIQSGVPGLNRNDVYRREIPLPPLEVQKEIVEQIEVKQAAIDAAKAVIKNLEKEQQYFGHELEKVDGVEWVDLGSISERITKGTTPTTIGNKFEEEGINFIKIESIAEDGRILKDKLSYISEDCNLMLKRSQLRKNDILFSIAGAFGRVAIVPDSLLPANTNQALAIISLKKEINSQYVYNYLKSANIFNEISKLKVGVAQYNISLRQVSKLKIPLPKPIAQQKMVEEANVEDAIIASNRELIKMLESRISKILVEI